MRQENADVFKEQQESQYDWRGESEIERTRRGGTDHESLIRKGSGIYLGRWE